MRGANFAIIVDSAKFVVLNDLGPWDRFKTITNAAESVVRTMHVNGLGPRRLFYYDSDSDLTELVHDGNGKFVDFRCGVAVPEDA